MDFKNTVEVAAALAGLVSTSLEVQRRVSDYRLGARENRLRARAEELARFLQIQAQLGNGGADEQLARQAISSTKAELDTVLKELVKAQHAAGPTKLGEMSFIRRGLLLFVPVRRFAWVLHFGFYFSVCLLGLSIFEVKELLALKLPWGRLAVGLEIFNSFVAAVVFRHWALMEQRWAEGFRPAPSPKRRRLLWYLPASRREMIARAALVFALSQFVVFAGTTWISPFAKWISFIHISVTVIVFYSWSIAELSLATHPVEMKFPRNLRFLRWPRNLMTWFWTICFYFMVWRSISFLKQVVTVNVIPVEIRNVEIWRIGATIGLIIGFLLADLLPLYGLHRILLAQSGEKERRSLIDLLSQTPPSDLRG